MVTQDFTEPTDHLSHIPSIHTLSYCTHKSGHVGSHFLKGQGNSQSTQRHVNETDNTEFVNMNGQ